MVRAKVPFKFVLGLFLAALSFLPDVSAHGAVSKPAAILVSWFSSAIPPAPLPRAGRLTGGVL
jgi:hypothetical protein